MSQILLVIFENEVHHFCLLNYETFKSKGLFCTKISYTINYYNISYYIILYFYIIGNFPFFLIFFPFLEIFFFFYLSASGFSRTLLFLPYMSLFLCVASCSKLQPNVALCCQPPISSLSFCFSFLIELLTYCYLRLCLPSSVSEVI